MLRQLPPETLLIIAMPQRAHAVRWTTTESGVKMFHVDVSEVKEGRLVIRQVESPVDPVLKGFAIELNGADLQFVRDHLNELLLDPTFPDLTAQAPNVTRLDHYATNWGASGELVQLVIDAGVTLAIEDIGRRLFTLFGQRSGPLVASPLSESTARFQIAVVYDVRASDLQLIESGSDLKGNSKSFRFRRNDGTEYFVEIADDHGFPTTTRHSQVRDF